MDGNALCFRCFGIFASTQRQPSPADHNHHMSLAELHQSSDRCLVCARLSRKLESALGKVPEAVDTAGTFYQATDSLVRFSTRLQVVGNDAAKKIDLCGYRVVSKRDHSPGATSWTNFQRALLTHKQSRIRSRSGAI